MQRLALIVATLLVSGFSPQESPEVVPGRSLPRLIQSEVRPLRDELERAIAANDEEKTRKVCQQIVEVMGPWAGNPEAAPRYYQPIERADPDPEAVNKIWHEIDRRTRRSLLWVLVPDGDPKRMRDGLRNAGGPLIAYSVLAGLEIGEREKYVALIREGADYLLAVQRENGLFPFPDLRGKSKRFGAMIEKLLKRNPLALADGWVVDDLDGDLQYDNGICGVAMVEAFEATKDKKYLQSARKASDWAVQRPLCINWNYNAFSVWLLARYARASGSESYLEAALDKLRVGVLPGQMENGRWFDPHNAKLVYHCIIVRAMLELYRALDEEHEFRPTLRDSLTRAIDNAATQIRMQGASSNSTSSEFLSNALTLLGPNPEWEEALNINVNAGLHAGRDRLAPNVGIYLPHYIRYRMESSQGR